MEGGPGDADRFLDAGAGSVVVAMEGLGPGGSGEVDGSRGSESASESGIVWGGGMARVGL